MISMKTSAKNYDDMSEADKKRYNELKKKKILGNMNFIGELFVSKVIPLKIIDLINRTKFDQLMNEYQFYRILKQDEYKNYEDHLDGLLILNNKVGNQMDMRINNAAEDSKAKE